MTNDLNDLQTRIKSLKDDVAPPESLSPADEQEKGNLGKAYELIGTPIVAGAIGMGLDKLFSTSSIFFITLAFLGVCAAFWSIYKAEHNIRTPFDSKRLQESEKNAKKAAISEQNSEN